MVAHYTLRAFIRQASRELLTDHCRRRGVDLPADLAGLKPRNIESLIGWFNQLPDDTRTTLDGEFQQAQALANEAGCRTILDEARHAGSDLEAPLQQQQGFLDKSYWTLLNAPAVFDQALLFAARDLLPGRYWKRRLPLAGRPGADLSSSAAPLQTALQTYFQREEGRGKACTVEYQRRDCLHWFFAYPEGYSAAPLEWSEAGLGRRAHRPAFEVVFVFDDLAGTLDVYCQAGRPTIERLWQVFALTVLGIDRLPPRATPSYAIDALKARGFAFVLPPDSPVVAVRLRRLSFVVLGGPTTPRITIQDEPTADGQAIHAAIDRVFARGLPQPGRIALAQTKVVGAALVATLADRDGRLRRRSFDLSEKACALKYEGVDLALRRMLADSGIDMTGRAPDGGARIAGSAAE